MILSNARKFKIYAYLQDKVHVLNDRPSLLDRLECLLIRKSTLTFLLANDDSWEKEMKETEKKIKLDKKKSA